MWVTDYLVLSDLRTCAVEMCKGILQRMLTVALSHQQNSRTNISIWPTLVYDKRLGSNTWYLYEEKHVIELQDNLLKFIPFLKKSSKFQNSGSVCIECDNIKLC